VSDTLRNPDAVSVPSALAPSFTVTFMGCRGEAVVNSSSRVYSQQTGRPVSSVARAGRSSEITSCLPPNAPPTRLQKTRNSSGRRLNRWDSLTFAIEGD
jgi:hypothetical protein